MKRYVAYLASRAGGDGIIAYGLSDWYDIGPGDPGFCKLTTMGLTATATYFQDLLVMCQAAALLGRNDDATRYAADAHATRATFNKRFFDIEKRQYDKGSQTANAMPLALGIVESEHRAAVLDALVRDIRSRENHITAGDVGFRYVLLALSENGRDDVIFDLLNRTDPPSYGYQLARGATALTEAWDANRKSSHNHFMLGHAEAWFYESLAGIRVDLSQRPPRQIQFRPSPVGDVSWARASYKSVLGECSIHWERQGGRLRATVEVPPGAAAIVHLPGRGGGREPREVAAGRHQFDREID
jgi:hypothetical protein